MSPDREYTHDQAPQGGKSRDRGRHFCRRSNVGNRHESHGGTVTYVSGRAAELKIKQTKVKLSTWECKCTSCWTLSKQGNNLQLAENESTLALIARYMPPNSVSSLLTDRGTHLMPIEPGSQPLTTRDRETGTFTCA